MCIIIEDEVIVNMSAIIAVCGTNFCSFVADRRVCSVINNEWSPKSDDGQKIFKINDRLLFGATGIFYSNDFTEPFNEAKNITEVDIEYATELLIDYMNRSADIQYGNVMRNYLLGYKNADNTYMLREIHHNPTTHKIEVTNRTPTKNQNFAVSCALPPRVSPESQRIVEMVGDAIHKCSTHHQLILELVKIIGYIANKDETVGRHVSSLTIS